MRVAVAVLVWVSLLSMPAAARPIAPALTCRVDADCGYALVVCGRCDPCDKTWNDPANQAERRRVAEMGARARCMKPNCPACGSKGNWVGDRTICRTGQCSVAQTAASVRDAKDLVCKVDADCAIKPRSGCGCPPCGVRIPEAVSKKHADWLGRELARESCPRVRCAPCAKPSSTLPGAPVCHAGRCVLVPSAK